VGRESYGAGGAAEQVMRMLDAAPAPLVHLGLVNCEFLHELIEPLARSAVLARLRTLDLSKGVLMDADIDAVLRHAKAFAHLERIDVSENLLEQREDELYGALPNAIVAGQREPYDGERYAAVGE